MNLSLKPPVQYICVQKPKQTSWLYAETAGSKREDIQEIRRPPALDTANPEKWQILKELASWMQVCGMGSSRTHEWHILLWTSLFY